MSIKRLYWKHEDGLSGQMGRVNNDHAGIPQVVGISVDNLVSSSPHPLHRVLDTRIYMDEG